MLVDADRLPSAGERAAVPRDPPPRGRVDLQVQLAEPGADLDRGAGVAGREPVAV